MANLQLLLPQHQTSSSFSQNSFLYHFIGEATSTRRNEIFTSVSVKAPTSFESSRSGNLMFLCINSNVTAKEQLCLRKEALKRNVEKSNKIVVHL